MMKAFAFGIGFGLATLGVCYLIGEHCMKSLDDTSLSEDTEDDGWITLHPKI